MLDALLGALGDVDRLVLLGDTLELRHGPLHEVLDATLGILARIGEALGPGREVVLLPGNHDHELALPWVERRRRKGWPPPLGLEEDVDWRRGEPLAALAAALAPADVRAAYPGVRLRDDVWGFHGHYGDVHFTVPTFERLATGTMRRIVGPVEDHDATPDQYERILTPIYAWMHSLAQSAPPETGVGRQQASARIWRQLAGGSAHRPLRLAALRLGFGATIATLNRAGLGPLRADVSAAELRRAGVAAAGEAVARLEVPADHVLFGHTHRSGPWPRDDPGEWRAPTGARMWNTGSWVFEPHFVTRTPNESPYWPGAGVIVGDEGPPTPVRLLGDVTYEELRPPRA